MQWQMFPRFPLKPHFYWPGFICYWRNPPFPQLNVPQNWMPDRRLMPLLLRSISAELTKHNASKWNEVGMVSQKMGMVMASQKKNIRAWKPPFHVPRYPVSTTGMCISSALTKPLFMPVYLVDTDSECKNWALCPLHDVWRSGEGIWESAFLHLTDVPSFESYLVSPPFRAACSTSTSYPDAGVAIEGTIAGNMVVWSRSF